MSRGHDFQHVTCFCEFLNDRFDVRRIGNIAPLNTQTNLRHRSRSFEVERPTLDRGELKSAQRRVN
jgi:hypothetical protein